MKNCAYCGRENEDRATQCRECGTEFVTEPRNPPTEKLEAPDDPVRAEADKRMRSGALLCLGGFLVTLVSYFSAVSGPFGGTHIFAWGAILVGGLRFYQGWSRRSVKLSSEDIGYEALEYGAKLETEGRIQEALAVYQGIIEEFPGTEASKDAKKSIENLKANRG